MPFTFSDLVSAAGQILLVMAACFALACLVISHLRYQSMTREAQVVVEEGSAAGDWEKRACERIEQHLMLDQRRAKRAQIEAPLMGMTN